MNGTWAQLAQPPHEITEPLDLPWRDNAWLSLMDPVARVFGTVHVSTSPNAGARRAQCNLNVDGRWISVVEPLEPGTFTSPSITYDLAGSVEVNAPNLTMRLRLTPRFQLVDYTASEVFVPLDDKRPLQHFQQGTDIEGEVVVGGVRTAISGCGLRDRTWGFRQETAHVTEYVSVMACFHDHDVTVMKFDSPTGTRTHGFAMGETVSEASGLTVRRDVFSHYDGGEVHFRDRVETLEVVERFDGVGFAIGEGGFGPSLSVQDEFVIVRNSAGQVGPAIIEQGILRRVC